MLMQLFVESIMDGFLLFLIMHYLIQNFNLFFFALVYSHCFNFFFLFIWKFSILLLGWLYLQMFITFILVLYFLSLSLLFFWNFWIPLSHSLTISLHTFASSKWLVPCTMFKIEMSYSSPLLPLFAHYFYSIHELGVANSLISKTQEYNHPITHHYCRYRHFFVYNFVHQLLVHDVNHGNFQILIHVYDTPKLLMFWALIFFVNKIFFFGIRIDVIE